jgi:hypothetical protein
MFNLAWINSAIKLTQLREFVGKACSKMLSSTPLSAFSSRAGAVFQSEMRAVCNGGCRIRRECRDWWRVDPLEVDQFFLVWTYGYGTTRKSTQHLLHRSTPTSPKNPITADHRTS